MADLTPGILIIDDERALGEILKEYLEALDYKVFYAENGLAGLDLLAREKPLLVLLDMLMPGMDGMECLKEIKMRSPETIVVMVTAVYDEKTAKRAIQAGAYEYITKPLDLEKLRKDILSRIFL